MLQPRSSPTATSSTSTCTESKRPTSPHHRERDRDAAESAPPSKSPRHSPSSPRHETFASTSSSETKACPAASNAATTCTVSSMKTTYYDSKPGCSTESSNPPSPPGATGGAEGPNYLDYLPPTGYGKNIGRTYKSCSLGGIVVIQCSFLILISHTQLGAIPNQTKLCSLIFVTKK